jgi:CBS domain-containing protein
MAGTARDVMQTHVVSVSPDTPISDVQRLFYEESIHGAPVVDQLGRVLGMLSSADLLRAAAEAHDVAPAEPSHHRNDLDLSHQDWERAPTDIVARIGEATVEEVMSPGIVHVAPDTPVTEVARQMRELHIHRVVVLEDDKLCGVISTFDLIGLLAED